MPFTPTHLAAILPIARLSRGFLPFSALAIGSMIPDLPLFLPLPVGLGYATTHSLIGLVTACLPLGLIAFALFHGVMKRPLADLLPRPIRSRVASLARSGLDRSPATFGKAGLAIVLGGSTHLLWDSFTHHDRWGTRLIPQLENTVFALGGYGVTGFKALQYGSTVVCLPGLLILLLVWLSRSKPEPWVTEPVGRTWRRRGAWIIAALIPLVVTAWVAIENRGSRYQQIGRALTTSGLALIVASLGYCLVARPGQIRRSAAFVGKSVATVLTLLSLSSFFAYSTAGLDFESSTATGIDTLYLRVRWDDWSTWLGYAIQPCVRPARELDWFDLGGTILDRPTHPTHRSRWNDLSFWRVDAPEDDPYRDARYPGATTSRWWACPSWLVAIMLWPRTCVRLLTWLKIGRKSDSTAAKTVFEKSAPA